MQKLEGFQYATELYINMVYYTISIYPASQDMKTIVTELGKFRYNCLHMGMFALGDIFQAKVDELLSDIKGVKIYIDSILVLSKDSFKNNIKQLRITFVILRAAGLKVDAPKCIFGLKEIPCLGYIITREVIKPGPNKLQGIMDIGRQVTTTEARVLIVMVHYYRNMWPRQSHVLAPLKEAASNPKDKTYFGMTL